MSGLRDAREGHVGVVPIVYGICHYPSTLPVGDTLLTGQLEAAKAGRLASR